MKQAIALILAVASIRSACLSAETLKNIGFASTQDLTKPTGAKYCTDLFAASGSCVPEASIEAKLKADNEGLSTSTNAMIDMFDAISEYSSLLTEIAGGDKDAVKAAKNALSESRGTCINAWNTIQQGVTCYLASGDASTYTTVGSEVSVKVLKSSVGAELYKCLPVVVALCEFTAGVQINTTSSASIGSMLSGASFAANANLLSTACTTLKTNYSCSTTDCLAARQSLIVDTFFAPYDYSAFPSVASSGTLVTALKTVTDTLKLALKAVSRRLATTTPVKAKANDTGADAKTYGDNSNYDKLKGEGIFKLALPAFVAALVAVISK